MQQLLSLQADVPHRVFSALDRMTVEVETSALFLGHVPETSLIADGIVEVACDCGGHASLDAVNVFDSYLLDGPCVHESRRNAS